MSKKRKKQSKQGKQTYPVLCGKHDLTGPISIVLLALVGIALGYLAGILARWLSVILKWFFA